MGIFSSTYPFVSNAIQSYRRNRNSLYDNPGLTATETLGNMLNTSYGKWEPEIMPTKSAVPSVSPETKPEVKTPPEEDEFKSIRNMDYALSAAETGASLFQAVQAIAAKSPTVGRVAAPQITMPEFYDTTEAARAGIKENIAATTNTVLERAKEAGQYNIPMATSVLSAAATASNRGNIALSSQRQQLLNSISQLSADVQAKNAQLGYTANVEYQRRKDEIMTRDAALRSQQLSAAISNIGGISSRLMNDALYMKILKS